MIEKILIGLAILACCLAVLIIWYVAQEVKRYE